MEKFYFVKTRNVPDPNRAHTFDAGCDFYCPMDLTSDEMNEKFAVTGDTLEYKVGENGFISEFVLKPSESILIPSGIKVRVPPGYVMNFENKSGVASKKHLIFGSKVVDCGYEGVVHVNLHNVGSRPVTVKAGEKIAQALVYKVETPVFEIVANENDLYGNTRSDRGTGGFGSTDR